MGMHICKILHLIGVMVLFLGFGGLIIRSAMATNKDDKRFVKFTTITHGVGLTLVLLGGFGMLGMGKIGFPGWVIFKLMIWIVLGGLIVVAKRMSLLSMPLWILVIILGSAAAFIGHNRGFSFPEETKIEAPADKNSKEEKKTETKEESTDKDKDTSKDSEKEEKPKE